MSNPQVSAMMGVSIEYAYLSISLSLFAVSLSIVYLWRVVKAYRQHHDERAAVALAKSIGLVVMACGMMISAVGLAVSMSVFPVAGLSMARGAFVLLMATLVLADVRPGGRSE